MAVRTDDKRILLVMPRYRLVRKAVAAGFDVWSLWDPRLTDAESLRRVADASHALLLADRSDERELRALVRRTLRQHGIGHVLHLGADDPLDFVLPVLEEAWRLGRAPNPPSAVRALSLLGPGSGSESGGARGSGSGSGSGRLAADRLPRAVPRPRVDRRPVRTAPSPRPSPLPDGHGHGHGHGPLPDGPGPSPNSPSRTSRQRSSPGFSSPGFSGPVPEEPGLSVQAFSAGGRHRVVGVTARRGSGHVHPAPPHAVDGAAVERVVVAALDAVGHRFGPTHFEVVPAADGPRVVRARAGLAGERIPLLVHIARGVDLEAAVFGHLLDGEPVPVPEARRFSAIGFFRLPPGRLRTVAGIDSICALPYTEAVQFPYSPGDVIPAHDTGNGYVVVSGETEEEAGRRVACALALLRADVREEAGEGAGAGTERRGP